MGEPIKTYPEKRISCAYKHCKRNLCTQMIDLGVIYGNSPRGGKARISTGSDKSWVERKEQKCQAAEKKNKTKKQGLLAAEKPHRENRLAGS